MRDAQADISRRAWVTCPRCAEQNGCAPCARQRSCEAHWRFLLSSEGRQVFVQCPECWYRWWHDTGFGASDRPKRMTELPEFPSDGYAA